MKQYKTSSFILSLLLFTSCSSTSMNLTSNAFKHTEEIPMKYTCDGTNISPELTWSEVPDNTKTFALIADDPDAPVGLWVHWLIYNIPADLTTLQEAFPVNASLPNGILQGTTSFNTTGYGGPCPPDKEHRYFFKLYALDTELDLPAGATKEQLEEAMKGHILTEAELMGVYNRPQNEAR